MTQQKSMQRVETTPWRGGIMKRSILNKLVSFKKNQTIVKLMQIYFQSHKEMMFY